MNFELRIAKLEPILQAYIDSRARVSAITGPLGSGKTFGSCQKMLTLMTEQAPNYQRIRKTRFYAVRNTYPDLMTTTIKDWRELFDELGRYKGGGMEPPTHKLLFRMKDNTIVQSELIFLALDRPQSIKRLRGAQATGFWMNELKELEKAVIDMADLRHGRYPSPIDGGPSWHGMFGDTNSCDDDHWLYNLEQVVKPANWEFFRQPGGLMREMVLDVPEHEEEVELANGKTTYITVPDKYIWTGKWLPNPEAENLHNLPKNYYIQGQEGKTTEWIAVNLGNEYGSVHTGKPVYKEQWNSVLHKIDHIQLIPKYPIVVGLDFGLTPAAVIGQETPLGTINILDELTSEGMGIQQFCEHILWPHLRAWYDGCPVSFVGDPAGNHPSETRKETVFQVLEECGIECTPASTNAKDMRIEAVRYFLQQLRGGRAALQVHPRCKVLIKGFNGGYQFVRLQVTGSEKYRSEPDKNKYSHPHDALQYLCLYYKGDIGTTKTDIDRGDEGRWSA